VKTVGEMFNASSARTPPIAEHDLLAGAHLGALAVQALEMSRSAG
jgi:hypothetical protein